jgi:hypothetical protein
MNQFTIDDFRMMFPSSQPTKTIHDLITLHFMRRIHRGTYQIIRPEDYVRDIVRQNVNHDGIVSQAEKPYAYCRSTAVTVWTDGYYWTDFTKGFKPIHIQVFSKDVSYWTDFFKRHDVEYIFVHEKKTMFGVTYIIHPHQSMIITIKDGDPVIALQETIQFCKENMLLYRPAMEYLDNKYHLGLFSDTGQVAS